MSEDAPGPRVVALQWGHVERNWIETTNSPILYSVLLDDTEPAAPFALMLAPNTLLGMFPTMEKGMDAAQEHFETQILSALEGDAPARGDIQSRETP